MKHFFDGFPSTAHPMAILSAMVLSLSSYYPDALDVDNNELRRHHHRAPPLEGAHHRGVLVQEVDRPAVRLSEELALVLRQLPQHDVLGPGRALRGRPGLVKVMNLLLILHADHEQNCSTSTVRLVGSSTREPLRLDRAPASAPSGARSTAAPTRRCSRCSSAIHKRRRRRAASTSTWPRTRTANFRLMGFGHRVYKNFDPRAKIIKARGRQGARRSSASRTRCSTSRRRSKRPRSRTATSSSASSTRTSTSTRASSTARWASPRTCSPCSSRSAACPAGSPTGRR